MRTNNIFAVFMLSIAAVEAAPSGTTAGIEKRDNGQVSDFMQCLRGYLEKFPNEGKPTVQQLKDCTAKAKAHTKREVLEPGALIWEPKEDLGKREDALLIWEPEEKSLESRGIISSVTTLGKALSFQRAACLGKEVRNQFVWAKELKDKIDSTCKDINAQIESSGLTDDGGVGKVIDLIGFGHNKMGNQLKDNVKLTASYMLNFYPPTGMALNEIKQLAAGVEDLCNDAMMAIGTKDQGCVANLGYYRPSKAKTYHDDGQIGGIIPMMWDNQEVASFSIDFSDDH